VRHHDSAGPNKLIQFQGKSLARRIVDLAHEAGCDPIVVLVGSEKEKVAAALDGTPARILENQVWHSGMGTSTRAGVQGLIDIEPKNRGRCVAGLRPAVR
jgi:molybdenum cofactor cytidylyltransferase